MNERARDSDFFGVLVPDAAAKIMGVIIRSGLRKIYFYLFVVEYSMGIR